MTQNPLSTRITDDGLEAVTATLTGEDRAVTILSLPLAAPDTYWDGVRERARATTDTVITDLVADMPKKLGLRLRLGIFAVRSLKKLFAKAGFVPSNVAVPTDPSWVSTSSPERYDLPVSVPKLAAGALVTRFLAALPLDRDMTTAMALQLLGAPAKDTSKPHKVADQFREIADEICTLVAAHPGDITILATPTIAGEVWRYLQKTGYTPQTEVGEIVVPIAEFGSRYAELSVKKPE